MKIAIVVSQYNKKISDRLLGGAKKALAHHGVKKISYKIIEVPGAFEIPLACAKLTDAFDGIIALGCVLEGKTHHFRAVCDGVTYGIQKVMIEHRIPIMFGVLMCTRLQEALDRSGENQKWNKGYECGEGLLKIIGFADR